jgi:hypothetical protein
LKAAISLTIDKTGCLFPKNDLKAGFWEQTLLLSLLTTMNTEPAIAKHIFLFRTVLLAGIACLTLSTHASTFWNGVNTGFTYSTTQPLDVLVAGKVGLTRTNRFWLYNPLATPPDLPEGANTPTDTTWAVGTAAMIGHLSASNIPAPTNFIPFGGATLSVRSTAQGTAPNFNLGSYLLGEDTGMTGPITFVVHLVNEDTYLTLTFTSWGISSGGGFAYTRSTPSVAPPTPTVSITNPAPNAVFAAPANIAISASASVSSGTVTNVSFFNGGSLLGSKQGSPFNFTANSLGAGSYSLTAVATAAGVSATSSVVSISVVTPVNTLLSSPAAPNNEFVFSYTVNPGLRYVIESALNLSSGFTPVTTNVPASSPAFFTNPISAASALFRVGRMPNP